MDIRYPIRTVVSTLDGPVLEVLARTTRPLTGREVHRLARTGSSSGVRLVLARLAEQGIVYSEHRATAVFYAANRDHLAWTAIETLANLRRTLLQRLLTEFESWQLPPLHASLFGSTARADGDETSDIDILLIRPDGVAEDESPWADQVDRLRRLVMVWTGNRCQAFQLDRQRLAAHVHAQDPLIDSLLRDAITLAGPELRVALRNLPALEGER